MTPEALCTRISDSLGAIVSDHLRIAAALLPTTLRSQLGGLPRVGSLGTDPQSLKPWKELAALTLTGKGEWRKAVTKALGPEYESASAKAALKSAIELLSAVPRIQQTLVELKALPAATLSNADAAAIEALSRVLRAAAVYLQAEFAVSGRIDHTYVAGAAREALADAGLPTDLALRTGMSLRHILVDEFQDTSLAQFDLIETLTAGWEESDGRTLFVVGDPMQSIYQFREAEVGLFLRARDGGIGTVRLEPLRLTRNFRSVPDLIGWINDAFTTLFPAQDDLRASAVSFTPSVAGREAVDPQGELAGVPTASVQFRLFDNATRESETEAIIQRIAAIRGSEPQSSVAVLVASRSHAAPIITGLEARKIDAVGVDLVPLRELSVVRDLVALLRALSHLGDRTSWLAVLRAPWCGLTLETLTVLSRRRDPKLVWEALSDEQRLERCCAEELARVVRVRGVLEAAMESRNSMPLADWLEMTWLRLGAADAYATDDLRHARAFFEALSERVAGGEWSGPQDLDSLLGDLYAQPQTLASNPVQLMTIHRAKGLEFDHVFVPSLDRELNRGREPLLRWLDLPRTEGQSDLIMAPVPAIGDDEGGEVTAYLKRLISRRAANEQTRLLYVAATRAKQTLQLSAAPKPRADGKIQPRYGTLLASLWPAVVPMLAAQAAAAAVATQGGTDATDDAPLTRPIADPATVPGAEARNGDVPIGAGAPQLHQQPLRRLIPTWSLPDLTPAPDLPHLPVAHQSLEPPEFSWVGETARHIGTVVHAALEQYATAKDLPAHTAIEAQKGFYEYQLRRHGVPEADLPRAASVVVEALMRTVSSHRGRWIFAPEHSESRSEWALTGISGGRLTNVVIDRSFVDQEGTRWVIDFKTSRHEGGGLETFLEQEMDRYRAQLETYVTLARGTALAPGTATPPVRAALYFPLLDVFRELT